MTRSVLLLAMLSLPLSAAAVAADPAAPAPAEASKPKPKKGDPNEVVCEKQEVLGSRLATRKVCMTRAEWADVRRQDRQAVERVQTLRGSASGQ